MRSETEEVILEARKISKGLKPSRQWQRMAKTNEPYPDEATIWANNVYTATLRKYQNGWPLGGGPWAMIGIYCEDGEARHDWRDFQRIKNDLVGEEWEALELYPAESRLLDPSNYFMLWCAPKIPIGKFVGRTIVWPESCISPQRGWRGEPPQQIIHGGKI